MPTYEYECKKCQKTHEIFHSITAKPIKQCPRCKGPLKRLMSLGSGFLFKGSGFYITDYRSKSYTEGKKKDQQASSGSSCSGDKSSCKKPGCGD